MVKPVDCQKAGPATSISRNRECFIGSGADEQCAGYGRYRKICNRGFWSREGTSFHNSVN